MPSLHDGGTDMGGTALGLARVLFADVDMAFDIVRDSDAGLVGHEVPRVA